jgi:uncharacterized repeat protein (TIGR03803 family)
MSLSAQTFHTLTTFDGTNGGLPVWDMFQGTDGNFYGSSGYGGANDLGTVFRVTPTGKLTTLQNLTYSHLSVQATDGNFYGTTPGDGTFGGGTVFKMTAAGQLTTLYNFCSLPACLDGQSPYGGVIQGSDGNFYGANAGGGTYMLGTVYKITPAGTLTVLFNFPSPEFVGTALVQGTDGNFYGVTEDGGAQSNGTVFRVTPQGTLTTLHTFQGTDGYTPYGALIQASDGNFYGTTYVGGANPTGCNGYGCGTIFKITLRGKLTTLYSFCSESACSDGQWPSSDLVQGSDGNFYGTTQAGGAFGTACPFGDCGTVFKMTPQGVLTTLHSFAGSDGSMPYAGLTQGTNGIFYGSTNMGADFGCGGGSGCGTVFSLAMGLSPFVETRPTTGKAGARVIVLGNNLTGATGVEFNGMAAVFRVVSKTQITATVPSGATTGFLSVTTPGGTLKSNKAFRVMP